MSLRIEPAEVRVFTETGGTVASTRSTASSNCETSQKPVSNRTNKPKPSRVLSPKWYQPGETDWPRRVSKLDDVGTRILL